MSVALSIHWLHKHALIGLMITFVIGNAAGALAPAYGWIMAALFPLLAIATALSAVKASKSTALASSCNPLH